MPFHSAPLSMDIRREVIRLVVWTHCIDPRTLKHLDELLFGQLVFIQGREQPLLELKLPSSNSAMNSASSVFPVEIHV